MIVSFEILKGTRQPDFSLKTPSKKYVDINGKVSKDKWQSIFRYLARYVLLLPPHHLVDDAYVALNDFHYLGGDILIHIIGDGDAMLTVFAEFYGGIYSLEEALGVDAGNDEVTLVNSLGTLGRGTDADGREGMAYTGEEAALLGEGA